LALRHSHGWC